jgi:hypothetical protein
MPQPFNTPQMFDWILWAILGLPTLFLVVDWYWSRKRPDSDSAGRGR